MWLNELSRFWRYFGWGIIRHVVQPTMPFCRNLAAIKGETIHIGINNEAISGHEVGIILKVLVPIIICSYQSSSTKIGFSKYPVKRGLPSSCNFNGVQLRTNSIQEIRHLWSTTTNMADRSLRCALGSLGASAIIRTSGVQFRINGGRRGTTCL